MSQLTDGRLTMRALRAVLTGLAMSVRHGVGTASGPSGTTAHGLRPGLHRGLRRGLLLALLCLPLPFFLAAGQAQAQSADRNLTIGVRDADEGENIVLTLTLSSAPGSVSAAQRTFKVSTAVPSSWDVITCISSSFGCSSGDRSAIASDFTATNTSVVFGEDDTEMTVSIPTSRDRIPDDIHMVRIDIDYDPGTSDLGIFTAGSSQYSGRTGFVSGPSESTNRLQINTYGRIKDVPANFLSISAPASADEGDSDKRDLEFAVSLTKAMPSTSVFYRVCFTGTATIDTTQASTIPAAADYQAISGMGTYHFAISDSNCVSSWISSWFPNPAPPNVIGIRIKGDTDVESNETVIATLTMTGDETNTVFLGTSVVTHTIVNDDYISVPSDWALKPADAEPGDQFRLLFVTSTGRNAQSGNIADYNTFVQTKAKAGHSAITDEFGDLFKVVGSTRWVNARQNTSTNGTGVPIYWLNGEKVADNYGDFYDGSWDSIKFTNADGSLESQESFSIWTGSHANGTRHNWHLGYSGIVRHGLSTRYLMSDNGATPDSEHRFYALSPVFEVRHLDW